MSLMPRLLAALAAFVLMCSMQSVARADEDFLPPHVAFQFSARMADPQTVEATWRIAEGYYMYREQFKFKAAGARVGAAQIPPGKVKFDETFNKEVETYRHRVTIRIPVEATGPFALTATGQGCSDKGLCYSPQDATAQLSPAGGVAARSPVGAFGLPAMSRPGDPVMEMSGTPAAAEPVPGPAAGIAVAPAAASAGVPAAVPTPAAAAVTATGPAAVPAAGSATGSAAVPAAGAVAGAAAAPAAIRTSAATVEPAPQTELGRIQSALRSGRLTVIVPLFLIFGLGLAFTPCVLPMVPILSSIIVGEGTKSSRGRGLALSLSYSLGMAVVYTALGVAAGLAGEGLAAALQNPWVLGGFGLLMALLALSMFGVYELQMPAGVQTWLAAASGRRAGGKLAGVFTMGAISALIVGPCVAAPLAGALVYISQSRDAVIGATALFSLAMGMSVPLILVGLSAGTLLPRAGAWMDAVKRFFGVLLLAMAWWLVSPVIPGTIQMAGWTLLGIAYGIYLLRHHRGWAAQGVAALFIGFGIVQMIGVATGARDPLAPLAHLMGTAKHELEFTRIKSVEDLDRLLVNTGNKTVMLDFYADWCVACKEMEKLTFADPAVQQRLVNTVLIQADVTANDDADKALLKRFNLFGPPGIIFFDRNGREIADSRVIGFQGSEKFLIALDKLK